MYSTEPDTPNHIQYSNSACLCAVFWLLVTQTFVKLCTETQQFVNLRHCHTFIVYVTELQQCVLVKCSGFVVEYKLKQALPHFTVIIANLAPKHGHSLGDEVVF